MNGQITVKVQLQQEGPQTHTRDIPGDPAQMIKETVPLDPTGHILHKSTLPRLGVIADLPYIEKQTQRDN